MSSPIEPTSSAACYSGKLSNEEFNWWHSYLYYRSFPWILFLSIIANVSDMFIVCNITNTKRPNLCLLFVIFMILTLHNLDIDLQ